MPRKKPPLPTVPVDVLAGKAKRGPGRPRSPARALSSEIASAILEGTRLLENNGKKLDPKATPLDVLIEAMREAYALGGAMFAAQYAEKAAPYIHAKIANIELRPQGSNPTPESQVQRLGLDKFYVDFIDVEATEVKDEDDTPDQAAK